MLPFCANFLRGSLLGYAILCAPFWASGHGALHEQIKSVTAKIAARTGDADLFLQRAELYRLHGDWNLALADCETAETVRPNLIHLQLLRGKIFFDIRNFEQARVALDEFLSIEPNHSEALLARAHTLVNLKNFDAATMDFSAAIQHAKNPEPDYYFERAQACEAAGNLPMALTGINEGIARLGPIVSLETFAIDLEIKLHRYDDALARTDLLAAQSQRKEIWLVQRGEILEKAARRNEAIEAYRNASLAIERLPVRYQSGETIQQLKIKLAAALKRLEAK